MMRKRFKVYEYSEQVFYLTGHVISVVALDSQETGKINFAVPSDSQIAGRAKNFVANNNKDFLETGLFGYRDLVNLMDFKFGDELKGFPGLPNFYYHKSLFPPSDFNAVKSSQIVPGVELLSDLIDKYLEEIINKELLILAPMQCSSQADLHLVLSKLYGYGFLKIRVNGEIQDLEKSFKIYYHEKDIIEVVIDEFLLEWNLESVGRFNDSLRIAMEFGNNNLFIVDFSTKKVLLAY
jgi:hypothetical protein